ncbi:MAG: hypothetical protein ACW97V_04205 [Promethearchaeota archaeon]|jgi:hypothetical protein
MITTRESINYQFTLIFGYSSPNEVIAGDVIGPGRLTKQKVNELSREVIKYLTMYNAILRDYTGAEVFSIEFELHNIDEKDAKTKIYPKSMIFIPGEFKECESLLLALKPETGYLDVHKSRNSIINISKLFFEVEEFADRPDFSEDSKQRFYDKFASRFSQKLFGDLIEDKWNKKLIGLSTSLPTEKEMLNTYAKIISDVDILWYKYPTQIVLTKSKHEKVKAPFESQEALEHLKYSISEPSANFIVSKTLNLGTNLLNLANTGTLDEFQENVVTFIITRIRSEVKGFLEPHNGDWVINTTQKILLSLETYLNKFLEYSNVFLMSGDFGILLHLIENYRKFIANKGKLENENFEEICEITIKFLKQSVTAKEKIRVSELSSVLNYFSEIIKRSLELIRISLPQYLSRRRLKTLTFDLIEKSKVMFTKEQKPVMLMGLKLLEKFKESIFNQIEIKLKTTNEFNLFNEKILIEEFQILVKKNITSFFDNVGMKIEDLVSFAEIQMESKDNSIIFHIEKFKKFSSELNYLLSYILRHSTINRFIKDESTNGIIDPLNFVRKFHRFLEKRIGGIDLEWKLYILQWIDDYSKKFVKIEDQKNWTVIEIYSDLLDYIEQREENEQKLENFLKFLDEYIAEISDPLERKQLLEFYKQYELSIGIHDEFPKYVMNKIRDQLRSLNPQIEKRLPSTFFNILNEEPYSDFVEKNYLKYLSKLIPRPLTLILKHSLTNEEKSLFKGELFHVIDFKFWHDNVRYEISDNFKEVYREWMKK